MRIIARLLNWDLARQRLILATENSNLEAGAF
jgi:hypothetical protein